MMVHIGVVARLIPLEIELRELSQRYAVTFKLDDDTAIEDVRTAADRLTKGDRSNSIGDFVEKVKR